MRPSQRREAMNTRKELVRRAKLRLAALNAACADRRAAEPQGDASTSSALREAQLRSTTLRLYNIAFTGAYADPGKLTGGRQRAVAMKEVPQLVYTQQEDLERLEARIVELPDEAVVRIQLRDGQQVEGVVTVRPSMQVFRNAEGVEGFNAVVRIDDRQNPARSYYLWMDQISEILRLGSD